MAGGPRLVGDWIAGRRRGGAARLLWVGGASRSEVRRGRPLGFAVDSGVIPGGPHCLVEGGDGGGFSASMLTAQVGPRQDQTLMPSATPISLAARERLRDHQAATAKVVAFHAAALARLDTATTRRAAVVAKQDALVAAAATEVDTAIAEAAKVMGIEVAAAVLNLSKSEVRRTTNKAKR